MTKKENIEKEVKNVKAKVAEVKEKDALDLAVDTMELEKKVEKKAKAVKAKVAEVKDKDALDLTVEAVKAKVAEVKDKDALDLTVDAVELEKKVEKKAKAVKAKIEKKAEVFIQSPMGGEITPEEILAKAGNVDKVYVRLDQNKLHWVKGDETGSVDIW